MARQDPWQAWRFALGHFVIATTRCSTVTGEPRHYSQQEPEEYGLPWAELPAARDDGPRRERNGLRISAVTDKRKEL